MRKIALLLFICFPLFLQAQNKSTVSKKLKLGVIFAPEYSYRKLSVAKKDESIAFIIPLRNKNESALIGYTLGINAIYNLSKHLNLESGVNYSVKGYKTDEQVLTFEDQLTASGFGQIYGVNKFHFLEIPIKLGFSYGKKKTQFIAGIGVSTSFFLGSKSEFKIKSPNGNIQNYSFNSDIPYRTFNLSPTISAGINYNINNHSNIKIEPTFKIGLIPLVDAPIKERLWSMGLNIGYYISL